MAQSPDNIRSLQALLDQLLDETIDAPGVQTLRKLLAGSSAARRHYIRYVHQHANTPSALAAAVGEQATPALADSDCDVDGSLLWQEIMRQRLAASEAIETPSTPTPTSTASRRQTKGSDRLQRVLSFAGIHIYRGDLRSRSRTNDWLQPIRRFAVAALLLLAVGLIVAAYVMRDTGAASTPRPLPPQVAVSPEPPTQPPAQPPTDEGRLVATVGRLHDAKWDQPDPLRQNLSLHEGALFTLTSGFMELKFARGATAILEAPCEVRLVGDNEVYMTHGRMVSQVPQAAHGFTVSMRHGRVVDLGTEFGVAIEPDGAARVATFKGLVELHPNNANGQPHRVQLAAGWTIGFSDTGELDSMSKRIDAAIELAFTPTWEAAEIGCQVTGLVRIATEAPASVGAGAWEADFIRVLPERSGVWNPGGIPAMIGGRITRTEGEPTQIPPTMILDSYLVQLDVVGTPAKPFHAQGSIRFDKPIMGVVCDPVVIFRTNHLLGLPNVMYKPDDIAADLEGDDLLSIDPDGRTLHLSLTNSDGIDRLRVITGVDKRP